MTYHLFENELNQISHLNTTALGFFSAGSFFLSLLLTIATSWLYAGENISDAVDLLSKFGMMSSAALATGCHVVGFIAKKQRNDMVSTIKRETAMKSLNRPAARQV